jgi:hypothetical protein
MTANAKRDYRGDSCDMCRRDHRQGVLPLNDSAYDILSGESGLPPRLPDPASHGRGRSPHTPGRVGARWRSASLAPARCLPDCPMASARMVSRYAASFRAYSARCHAMHAVHVYESLVILM